MVKPVLFAAFGGAMIALTAVLILAAACGCHCAILF
jgi:hypothetical protein